MLNTFELGQTLPSTKLLKISWSEIDAKEILLFLMQIKTDDNKFSVVETVIKNVKSDFNPLDIDVDYDLVVAEKNIIASWKKSLNRTPEWLINCGDNSGSSCATNQYVIINTSFWSLTKRTISNINQSAISNLRWENLLDQGLITVFFNTLNGTPIDSYLNLLPGIKINKPTDPIRLLSTFDGWYTDLNFTNEWDFENDVLEQTITLYANWIFDENFIGSATTTKQGLVTLSNSYDFSELETNTKVITEANSKSIIQNIIDDFEEALDEI
jgi:uncharacterized repeat protein (TIGR02543 family)